MLIVGIIFSVFGIGFFCWLLFTLAVYALPFFAGLTAGLAAFHSGSGVIGALVVGAGGGVLKPSFLCARVSISSPGTSDHLCAALDVGHVFSQGCCSTPGPHGLSMA